MGQYVLSYTAGGNKISENFVENSLAVEIQNLRNVIWSINSMTGYLSKGVYQYTKMYLQGWNAVHSRKKKLDPI